MERLGRAINMAVWGFKAHRQSPVCPKLGVQFTQRQIGSYTGFVFFINATWMQINFP